jgi:hypothetical protein
MVAQDDSAFDMHFGLTTLAQNGSSNPTGELSALTRKA